jgi:hypothetical protein
VPSPPSFKIISALPADFPLPLNSNPEEKWFGVKFDVSFGHYFFWAISYFPILLNAQSSRFIFQPTLLFFITSQKG